MLSEAGASGCHAGTGFAVGQTKALADLDAHFEQAVEACESIEASVCHAGTEGGASPVGDGRGCTESAGSALDVSSLDEGAVSVLEDSDGSVRSASFDARGMLTVKGVVEAPEAVSGGVCLPQGGAHDTSTSELDLLLTPYRAASKAVGGDTGCAGSACLCVSPSEEGADSALHSIDGGCARLLTSSEREWPSVIDAGIPVVPDGGTLGASQPSEGTGRVLASEVEMAAACREGGAEGLGQPETAVRVIQRRWRRLRCGWTGVERGWCGARARRLGSIVAHVTFLQYIFRKARELRPGCWRRGGMRGLMAALRLTRSYRCGGGANLATEAEFTAQRERAERVIDWYRQYVQLLRRLQSGVTPTVVDDFCGGGGSSEGVRRAGGASIGLDVEEQSDFVRRFGSTSFVRGDGVSWADMAKAKRCARAFAAGASPPCKFYSTARRAEDAATQPPLIEATRDMLEALFEYWWMENVLGAKRHMAASATELFGALFGLRVDRARLFETSFEVHVDEWLRRPAERLRARCCLGERRRWRRLDRFGRPEREPCCRGNIYAVQGKSPWRCTADDCADAMGVDRGAMSYDRLAQALPPAYVELIFAQMCMRAAQDLYGAPAITFDDMLGRPTAARRELSAWLRGAGDASLSAGLAFVGGAAASQAEVEEALAAGDSEMAVAAEAMRSAAVSEAERQRAEPGIAISTGFDTLGEAEFRELYYSQAGGFQQTWEERGSRDWLARLRRRRRVAGCSVEALLRRNTYVELADESWATALPVLRAAIEHGAAGTRVTVVASESKEAELRAAGFEVLCRLEAVGGAPRVAMAAGRRRGVWRERRLDHAQVREFMDPRDRGEGVEASSEKAARSWRPMPHEPERWRGKGLPPEVESLMTEGARIEMAEEAGFEEVPQYAWPSDEALVECILEADRALAVGAMEYVPDDQLDRVLQESTVHPFTMAQQGSKWRACHDYSVGTNRRARSAPFALPTVWDVRPLLKPGSRFAKYDLRDGFYAVPVHPDSRHRLVMRHPGTGRLMWCSRLPFGYLDSPRLFCSVTEALAAELRRRVAGMGIHVIVFVDDWLVIGDDEAATRRGCEMLEALLEEFGLEWAPHKQRGPCAVIEFLGMLLSNVEGARCIALTESRQVKLRSMIDAWMARRPAAGEQLRVGAKELAQLLGHLVFGSQVVPGGRTYMQSMLSSFAGLEVDWRRGSVRRTAGGPWQEMAVGDGFWRDLEWWSEHLEKRNCVSTEPSRRGEAAVTGTDASGWGTGQLAWLDGAREEVQLEFTEAERRRPINWRELLGVLRVVETWGERLAGCCVLIEADNTAAVGAASKMASSAEDMQELVRRLLEACEEYGIELRMCHTPGVMLHRPDQTSRGDPVEEPRMRLNAAAYGELVARWGPFTEWIGSERRHAQVGARDGVDRLWVHPSHTTVGSALRLVGERLGECRGRRTEGIVLVPHEESAAWWQLTRHMAVVGRLPAGGQHLEANVLGEWRPAEARRDTIVLAFPRAEAEAAERQEQRVLAAALLDEAPEGEEASTCWREARAAAEAAAAARRHVQPVSGGAAGRRERAQVRAQHKPGGWLRCQYGGTPCAGCGRLFRRGERVRSAGGGLAHPREQCMEAAWARAARRSRALAVGAMPAWEATLEDARAYATWAQLEREFTLGEPGGRRLLLPRHSRERFIQLVEWMGREESRRALGPTVLRATGLFTNRTGLVDWGADPVVRARLIELIEKGARVEHPKGLVESG